MHDLWSKTNNKKPHLQFFAASEVLMRNYFYQSNKESIVMTFWIRPLYSFFVSP